MLHQHLFPSRTVRFAVITSLLLALIGMLHGCQVFHVLDVKMTANGLVFSNDLIEEEIAEDKRFILSTFGMNRHEPCDDPNGCGMWLIVRPLTEESDAALLKPSNLLSLPIRYGQSYPGMEVRMEPVPLTPGRYTVSGRVDGSSDGIRFDISLSFSNEFILRENAQGLLEVEEVQD